jgi:hypothetical protein
MPRTLIGSNSVYLAFLSKQLIEIYPKAPYSWVHSGLHNITGRTRIGIEIVFDRGQEEDLYYKFPRLHPGKNGEKVGRYWY